MVQPPKDQYSKKESRRRFDAALRGGLHTSPKPLKSMTRKGKKDQDDPMPENDPEALIEWAKRNIQK